MSAHISFDLPERDFFKLLASCRDDSVMSMNMYQKHAMSSAVYPNVGRNIIHPALGLAGEAGEVVDKIKKNVDTEWQLPNECKHDIAKELGDVLWQVASCASELGYTLEEIAKINLDKISSRIERGTLHGNGDDR